MDFFASVLRVLDWSMPTPEPYGWFHLIFLLGSFLLGIAFSIWHKKHPADRQRKVILTATIIVIILEIYKLINFSFSYEDGVAFDFPWSVFPFQFCSTPMYVGLLAGLTKPGKLHTAACAYTVTFSVFAGAAVMFYPGDIYIETIGINIQTSICHGSMIFLGIYLMATEYVKPSLKNVWKAAPLFSCLVALAVIMNEIAHQFGIAESESFNMFYISPYCPPHLPVYSLIQEVVPFIPALIIYVLGFSAAACVIQLIALGVQALLTKKVKQTA